MCLDCFTLAQYFHFVKNSSTGAVGHYRIFGSINTAVIIPQLRAKLFIEKCMVTYFRLRDEIPQLIINHNTLLGRDSYNLHLDKRCIYQHSAEDRLFDNSYGTGFQGFLLPIPEGNRSSLLYNTSALITQTNIVVPLSTLIHILACDFVTVL
ncbi:hypothetical protein P879_00337 [Paragonimus westermani]|uniref:Uncharacterized protein n=1 Tax=Paragonimus westermani TaxID=34504 RepID=A0A8T0DUL6_9TREM|nr:hypothetical protein P879_00337 [Paragonimus westermani]